MPICIRLFQSSDYFILRDLLRLSLKVLDILFRKQVYIFFLIEISKINFNRTFYEMLLPN